MRFLRFLLVVMVLSPVQAQEEEARFRVVADAFQEAYNAEEYEAIYEMFDSVMQKAFPLDKLQVFLDQQVRGGAGLLRELEFYRLQGSAHIYKSTFEKALLDLMISLDGADQINGLFLKPHMPMVQKALPEIARNSTPMKLPFDGKWFVFWGGEDQEKNYHMANINQQFAYDILKVSEGSSYRGDGTKNEDYFAFGEVIKAPCDATVVMAIDGVPDNVPGEMNPIQITGNTLVLKTEAGEYILMAHLKEGSIIVKKGQQVTTGQPLGQCGNSGNSSEAHLHLQLQNTRDFHKATGAKMLFEQILVNGTEKRDYMPVKEDFVENIQE